MTETVQAPTEVAGTLVLGPNLEARDKCAFPFSLAVDNTVLTGYIDHGDLPGHNLRALWHNEMRAFDGHPNTSCVPHIWKYAHDRKVILEAQKVTTTKEAERRALLMINPGMKRAPYTTDSVLGAFRLFLFMKNR